MQCKLQATLLYDPPSKKPSRGLRILETEDEEAQAINNIIYVVINPMKSTLNVTVESDLTAFLERYRSRHQLKTRSEAVEAAIRTLRHVELERDALEAANDPEQQADADWWAFTDADGLRG